MFLVFGTTGQVGSELAKMPNIHPLTRAQADLSNPDICCDIITTLRPKAVINAAAYTNIEQAENNHART